MYNFIGLFPGGSDSKDSLSAMLKTWVQSLGQEDPLEKGMAAHSNTLAWRIPWAEEPRGYSPWGPKESDRTEQQTFSFSEDSKQYYRQRSKTEYMLQLVTP